MDIDPLRVLAQQIRTEIHEPQARSFLQLCDGKIQLEQVLVRYGLTNSWMIAKYCLLDS